MRPVILGMMLAFMFSEPHAHNGNLTYLSSAKRLLRGGATSVRHTVDPIVSRLTPHGASSHAGECGTDIEFLRLRGSDKADRCNCFCPQNRRKR